jgi:hypothetical protein
LSVSVLGSSHFSLMCENRRRRTRAFMQCTSPTQSLRLDESASPSLSLCLSVSPSLSSFLFSMLFSFPLPSRSRSPSLVSYSTPQMKPVTKGARVALVYSVSWHGDLACPSAEVRDDLVKIFPVAAFSLVFLSRSCACVADHRESQRGTCLSAQHLDSKEERNAHVLCARPKGFSIVVVRQPDDLSHLTESVHNAHNQPRHRCAQGERRKSRRGTRADLVLLALSFCLLSRLRFSQLPPSFTGADSSQRQGPSRQEDQHLHHVPGVHRNWRGRQGAGIHR